MMIYEESIDEMPYTKDEGVLRIEISFVDLADIVVLWHRFKWNA